MTIRKIRKRLLQAINVIYADAKRQEREALKGTYYANVLSCRSYKNGLDVAIKVIKKVMDNLEN